MSTKPDMPQEEIDLGTLFSQIGKMFSNFFNFFGNIFKSLYHYFILLVLFIRKNIIVISVLTIIGGLYGFVKDYISEKSYESEMVIETNYGSGKQLYKQIDNINNLIAAKDSIKVAVLLGVTPAEAGILKGFLVEAIDEQKQELLAYDLYMQETDTIFTRGFEVQDYQQRIESTDLRFHKINIYGKEKIDYSIFSKNINKLIANEYYIGLKNKTFGDLVFRKKKLEENLNQLDSLRKRYNEVALLQAHKEIQQSKLNLSTTKSNERNFDMDIYSWSVRLLEELDRVNKKINRSDTISRVKTDFGMGVKKKGLLNILSIKYGALGFILAIVILFGIQFNRYLNKYDHKNN